MKQKIGTLLPSNEEVSDINVFFVAVYNLIYERIEKEPGKGIVVSKGNPNQRKATWEEVMHIAHMMEDFFMCRKLKHGGRECMLCKNWNSTSKSSPHLGACDKKKGCIVHALSSCKRFEARRVAHE